MSSNINNSSGISSGVINKIRFKKIDTINNNDNNGNFIDIYSNNYGKSSSSSSSNLKIDDHNDEILSIPIGRSTFGLNIKDNLYISNDQVIININKNDQSINIVAKGINPTFLKKKNSNDLSNEIKKTLGNQLDTNISYDLADGDILSFLSPNSQSVSIEFEIEKLNLSLKNIEKVEKQQKNNTTTTATVSTTTTTSPIKIKTNNNTTSTGSINSSNISSSSSLEFNTNNNKRKLTSNENNEKKINLAPSTKVATTTTTTTVGGGISRGNWTELLYPYCKNPEDHDALYFDEKIVIIKDKYPKSKYHFLILPRKIIENFKKLTKDDIPLLEHMYKIGNQFLNDNISDGSITFGKSQFSFGFHAIPSMKQIHLHLISNDFQSSSLKKKEHWQSFTTDFFIPFNSFLSGFKLNGAVNIDKDKFEKLKESSLICPICKKEMKNIPIAKSHYLDCLNNK